MMKVMDVAEEKEGRLNGVGQQECRNATRKTDRRLYQALISCTTGEAKNHVCDLDGQSLRSEDR